MKKENILLFVLISIAVLGIGFYFATRPINQKEAQTTYTNDKGIEWKEYSDGVAIAKAENKHIFLYFYADW